MGSTPIGDHALVSDCHSAALIDISGSVEWLCFPRFDSPSVFARLLDADAGHWSIRPAGDFTTSRRYLERTLVLETTFTTSAGVAVVVDALALEVDDDGHRLGGRAPHLLIRQVTCTSGTVDIEIDYRPRPEYGLIAPILRSVDGGVTARGGAEWLVLSSPVPLTVDADRVRGSVTLSKGDTVAFALQRSTLEQTPARVWSADDLARQLESTVTAWRRWSLQHQGYDGPWADLVHHSGRVLQALTFQPSGAIVAAATTSLPESVGGARNWDYRFSWVRDASFTIQALWVAACPDEASDFFAFVATAAAARVRARGLQIMFGVGGEHDLTERKLTHLSGWRGSRPVRVGNAAWNQNQIDVYGELLDAAYRLSDHLADIDDDTRSFLVSLADIALERWREKDNGIWEVRGEQQHFVYSKVMCWVALDRAIRLQGRLRADDRLDDWKRGRDEIFEAVVREGWNEAAGAFTQYFGSPALDASVLMMPIVGFLPADDPRMLATVDAIEQRLTDGRGLVFRYRAEDGVDGLAGGEGTFLLCTFWLAHALALAGRTERARAVFERAVAYVNDVGLLAEEVDPSTGELLGNFPQAFSHIGLVNAAWSIAEAEQKAAAQRLTRTREDLHRVAEHVVSPARYAVARRIGLRPAAGGFATPPFGDPPVVVAVQGGDLVVRSGTTERRTRLATLREAAEFVGVEPGAPAHVYTPNTPLDLDRPLQIDAEAAAALADWYALAAEALQRFAADISEDNPSAAQLWPEHFDVAISAAGCNYGASPGDEHIARPYVYVGPHDGPPTRDEFWNAPFGAARTLGDIRSVDDAVSFFHAGRAAIRNAATRRTT